VSDLKELKLRIDILEVLRTVGARMTMDDHWSDEVKVWCPFCDDAGSRKPAASANIMKGLYHCYACGFGGSVIDIAIKYLDEKEVGPGDVDVFGHYTVGIAGAVAWLEERWPNQEAEDDDEWS